MLANYNQTHNALSLANFSLDIHVSRNAFGHQCDSFVGDLSLQIEEEPKIQGSLSMLTPAVFIRAPVILSVL